MKPFTASLGVKSTRLYYAMPKPTSVSMPSELLTELKDFKARRGYPSLSALIVRACEGYLIEAKNGGRL